MDILVPQKYSVRQINSAETKRAEFRPNRYTSRSANLDDMIALKKAVILCPTDARKFNSKAAHYRAHPAKHLQRVIGRCDVCQQFGLSFLFLNEKDADNERRKVEMFRRSIEYATILN